MTLLLGAACDAKPADAGAQDEAKAASAPDKRASAEPTAEAPKPTENASESAEKAPEPADKAKPAKPRKLEGPELDAMLGEAYAAKDLLHPAFCSALGDRDEVCVYVTWGEAQYMDGLVHLVAEGKPLAKGELVSWNLQSVEAMMFWDVDSDDQRELLVLGTYVTGAGREAAREFPATAVFDLVGGELKQLGELEAKIADAPNAKAIKGALGL